MQEWTASLTYSKGTESHVGAEIHGVMADAGYSLRELRHGKDVANARGLQAEVVELQKECDVDRVAYVLVIRNAAKLLDVDLGHLTNEYAEKIWPHLDRCLISFRKIQTKHARGNAELGPVAVASTYDTFKHNTRLPADARVTGVVLPFSELPNCTQVGCGWRNVLGDNATNLRAEVNHYGPRYVAGGMDTNVAHKVENCGIGLHGDSERKDVICICLGTQPRELHFQAFCRANPQGKRFTITLHPGDGYVMDEVACGSAWKKDRANSQVIHYRHAAGPCGGNKFIPTTTAIRSNNVRKNEKKEDKKRASVVAASNAPVGKRSRARGT